MKRRRAKNKNNAGSLYQERGQWVGVVSYKDGARTRRKKVRRDTMDEAIVAMARLRVDLSKGVAPPNERQNLRTFLAEWLEARKGAVRESTWNTYDEAVRKFLVPELGHVVLTHLSVQHVESFMRQMIARGKSAGRARYMRAVLRAALQHAMRLELIVKNVAQLAEPPKVEHKEAGYLTHDEARAFLDAVQGKRKDGPVPVDRLAALWIVALALGLRRGELVGLRWIDVDLDEGELHVRQQVQRLKHIRDKDKKIVEERGLVVSEPKSRQSKRSLRLPVFVVKALKAHAARQAAERLKAGKAWEESGHVFTNDYGGILDPRNVLRRFHELLTAAEMPKRKLHETRHTAATLLLLEGVAAKVAQEVLGHSDIRLTMNTYSHVTKKLHEEAAGAMEKALGASRRRR